MATKRGGGEGDGVGSRAAAVTGGGRQHERRGAPAWGYRGTREEKAAGLVSFSKRLRRAPFKGPGNGPATGPVGEQPPRRDIRARHGTPVDLVMLCDSHPHRRGRVRADRGVGSPVPPEEVQGRGPGQGPRAPCASAGLAAPEVTCRGDPSSAGECVSHGMAGRYAELSGTPSFSSWPSREPQDRPPEKKKIKIQIPVSEGFACSHQRPTH